jgi:glycine/sarcosine/betaine reductase complex component A
MDAEAQANIKRIAEDQTNRDNLIVVLGASDIDGAEISAETVTLGDPSYSGPLAGVPLGLPVYHILEPEVKQHIPEDVYNECIGIMAMVINPEEVGQRFRVIRERVAKQR